MAASPDTRRKSMLDGTAARAVAVLVALAAAGALAYLHRDDIRGSAAVASGGAPAGKADDPFSKCMTEHGAKIDQMVKDGVVQAAMAATFKDRAEGLCRASASGSTKAK